MINIISGLIKPTDGKVFYNDQELKSETHSNIAYVSQSSFFTNDTIKNNIESSKFFNCQNFNDFKLVMKNFENNRKKR